MKKTLKEFLEEQICEEMLQAVLSGQRNSDGPSKVKIRPIRLKNKICFQVSREVGPKVFHTNYTQEEARAYVEEALETGFTQLQVQGQCVDGTVLVSKKGKMTIKTRQHQKKAPTQILAHNRVKQYIIKEGIPVPFLIDLGVMNAQGKVVSSKYDKFRQINRFLEFIEDILPRLPREREVTILDFGCGKSYLTFAMYYYLHELKAYDIRIIGLDLKKEVIRHCNELAEKYGYEKLTFLEGDIADYEGVSEVDMVVTLHACDTATDYALAKAIGWNAKVILSVPCCQHELNKQIRNEILAPVMKYGLLKERFSALLTDGLRAEYLESAGYHVQVLEFIDMEHTPKNILLRAVKNPALSSGKMVKPQAVRNVQQAEAAREKKLEEIHVCEEFFGAKLTLGKLLGEEEQQDRGDQNV